MGLTSLNGINIGPQAIVLPRTIRGSISRVLPSKTPEQLAEEKMKNGSLLDLVTSMKS
jgi:hypothetical protein